MKTSILKVTAIAIFVCLLLNEAPGLFKNTSVAGGSSGGSLMGRGFYFGKRQWLADARTVMAAVRYLYESRSSYYSDPAKVSTPCLPAVPETDTNLMVINRGDPAVWFQKRHHSKAEATAGRRPLWCYYSAPSMVCDTNNRVNAVRIQLLQYSVDPINPVAAGLLFTPGPANASAGRQGA